MKFKVEVTQTYIQNHIVEADDENHALEIASEISINMEANHNTFFDSTWDVTQVSDGNEATYEPEQDYLK